MERRTLMLIWTFLVTQLAGMEGANARIDIGTTWQGYCVCLHRQSCAGLCNDGPWARQLQGNRSRTPVPTRYDRTAECEEPAEDITIQRFKNFQPDKRCS